MDKLFHPDTAKITEKPTALTLNESILAHAMLHDQPSGVITYTKDADGIKVLNGITDEEFPNLVREFRADPKDSLATARQNLFSIVRDRHNTPSVNTERLQRYIKAYGNLQIKLDRAAFPPKPDVVLSGVPDYIPDGLSDMGGDPSIHDNERSREKIRINKKDIFDRASELFNEIFSLDTTGVDLETIKRTIVERVAYFVYTEMPYDYRAHGRHMGGRSVTMVEIMDKQLAVCRHHSDLTQVLLQSFGITSRLLKCDVDTDNGMGPGAHAANLVRINNAWYLLDVTNPDVSGGKGKIFCRPIPENNIDTNRHDYRWSFRREKDGKTWTYKSRNNMYYRIMDNTKK